MRCMAKADKAITKVPCVECGEYGKKFAVASSRARHCSDACRLEAVRGSKRRTCRKPVSDPRKHAMALARTRAWVAVQRDMK